MTDQTVIPAHILLHVFVEDTHRLPYAIRSASFFVEAAKWPEPFAPWYISKIAIVGIHHGDS